MYLVIKNGHNAGRAFRLEASVTLGREPDCDIVLGDTQVSRRHAQIRNSSHGLVITDLQSHNGTFVNDLRLRGAASLRPGDQVRVGGTILVVSTEPREPSVAISTRGDFGRPATRLSASQPRTVGSLACPQCGQTDEARKVSAIVRGGVSRSEAEALAPPTRPPLGWLYLFAPQKLREAERQWQRAYKKWKRLHYCARCDGVYIPGETGLISVGQVGLLLDG
jgi:pSer/pThr/pTyr-binding forkhead associated (FHA) protein